MKKFKKILGWALLVIILPIVLGLLSLDGEICHYGQCDNVIPFWGGVLTGFIVLGFSMLLLGIVLLILWLIK